MELRGGEVIAFKIGEETRRWRISKIDGNVVKIFEEDGNYKQMSYDSFKELLTRVQYTVERADYF